jgi:hypothetical protein
LSSQSRRYFEELGPVCELLGAADRARQEPPRVPRHEDLVLKLWHAAFEPCGHGFFGGETVGAFGETFFSIGDFRIDASERLSVSKGEMVVGCLKSTYGLVIGDHGRLFHADARNGFVLDQGSHSVCVDRQHIELRDWRGKFQLANGRCSFESFVTAGTFEMVAGELVDYEGDWRLAMNTETVAFTFPKRRCLVTLDDAELSADVKIDSVGITMKLAFLLVKFLGRRIFVDHPGLIFRAGDTVPSSGDTDLTLRIGWSVFTFDEKSITLRNGKSTPQLTSDMMVLSADGFDFHLSQRRMELTQNTTSVAIQWVSVRPM